MILAYKLHCVLLEVQKPHCSCSFSALPAGQTMPQSPQCLLLLVTFVQIVLEPAGHSFKPGLLHPQ